MTLAVIGLSALADYGFPPLAPGALTRVSRRSSGLYDVVYEDP
jgi:hypothetical protein